MFGDTIVITHVGTMPSVVLSIEPRSGDRSDLAICLDKHEITSVVVALMNAIS